MNEAQTREDLITPAIRAAGWTAENNCQILVEQSANEFAPGRVGKVRLRYEYRGRIKKSGCGRRNGGRV